MRTIKKLLMTLMALCLVSATWAQGVKVEILSPVSGIIRVTSADRYVLLPVEESASESNVRVCLNGKAETTVQVRMALNHVDYYVPMDMSAYKGKNVVLYVNTTGDRSTLRDASSSAWSKETKTSNTFDTTNREKYRPAFHHTPEYGWMNDPNGQFFMPSGNDGKASTLPSSPNNDGQAQFADGVWHLYFQWNPYGSMWGNMTWGHSVSKDLIHWEQQPAAVWADGLGTVFSGSCVVDKDNTAGFGKDAVVGFYTSAAENQIQSLVYSTDGGHSFTHYEDNPVITSKNECRDPNLYWNDETKEWNLYLVSALTHEVWFYTSKDLKNWTKTSAFGGYGCLDGVWECPDLMKLPVRGTNKSKWMVILNINPGGPFGGSATQYFVGDWNGKTFTCESGKDVTKWMDYGKDHYATVSWPETNKVIAWMSNWQYAAIVPTKQFRSANSLPRELDLFEATDGETYVGVMPAKECEVLRGEKIVDNSFNAGNSATAFNLPQDGLCEIILDAQMSAAKTYIITLSNAKGEKVVMTYDLTEKTFAMDRRESGITDFSIDFPAVTKAPLLQLRTKTKTKTKTTGLRLFIDRCSIEAFDSEGKFAMTNLVFPTEPYTTISIEAEGKAKTNINVFEIKK